MKIAVTSSGPTLDDAVEPRFGRCFYFLLIDSETLAFESLPNPGIVRSGGADAQTAQLLAIRNVSAILTGSCGPGASQVFDSAGIQVITGVSGRVREVMKRIVSTGPPEPHAVRREAYHGG